MNLASSLQKSPFHLALSSGFFGFYAHVGFLKAIFELDLKPISYSGSSAGAIVAAAAANGFSIGEIEKLITGVSRKDFWDPSFGFGLLSGLKLETMLAKEIGSEFENLKFPMQISVFDIYAKKTHVIKSGNLALAIRASCAVPFMFHPVKIDTRYYWDGGIADKMAISEIPKEIKVLSHYLESTSIDPHSLYELKRDQKSFAERSDSLKVIQLKNLPRANPFTMNRGPEIIEAAYKKTLEQMLSN